MPEILTESFCERCGTRYTFESASPRGPRLKGLKVMSRGLKNFVLSDDTSMDEAMAAARNETDREQTTQQLDAFHKTFNFCMSCRQYTCGNCWNEAEGRCLSCAPHLGHEVLQAPFGNVGAGGAITLTESEAIGLHDRNGHDAGAPAPAEPMAWPEPEPMSWPEPEPMAWPTSDLTPGAAQGPSSFQEAVDAAAELEPAAATADVAPVTEDVAAPLDELPVEVEAEVVGEIEAPALETAPSAVEETVAPPLQREPEEVARVEPPVVPTPLPPIETVPPAPAIADQDRAAAAAANTSDLLQRFRPGQSLDDEIAAYERQQAAATGAAMAAAAEAAAAEADIAEARARAAAEAEAARQPLPEPEIAAAPRPEPVAPMPEPVAPMPEPEPVAAMPEPEPEPVQAEPAAAAWPEPVAAEPRDDVVYQPTWQIVAPEPPPADSGPTPQAPAPTGPTTEPIAASAEPQWPSRPEWPRPPSAEGLPFLGRPGAASGGIEALWAESAREVANVGPLPGAKPAGGVQPCVSCGLSLSANARFCRRCGTRQG